MVPKLQSVDGTELLAAKSPLQLAKNKNPWASDLRHSNSGSKIGKFSPRMINTNQFLNYEPRADINDRVLHNSSLYSSPGRNCPSEFTPEMLNLPPPLIEIKSVSNFKMREVSSGKRGHLSKLGGARAGRGTFCTQAPALSALFVQHPVPLMT